MNFKKQIKRWVKGKPFDTDQSLDALALALRGQTVFKDKNWEDDVETIVWEQEHGFLAQGHELDSEGAWQLAAWAMCLSELQEGSGPWVRLSHIVRSYLDFLLLCSVKDNSDHYMVVNGSWYLDGVVNYFMGNEYAGTLNAPVKVLQKLDVAKERWVFWRRDMWERASLGVLGVGDGHTFKRDLEHVRVQEGPIRAVHYMGNVKRVATAESVETSNMWKHPSPDFVQYRAVFEREHSPFISVNEGLVRRS